MIEISPNHPSVKWKGNNASTSSKGKFAKATKPHKEGCWICGKLGHRKNDCYIKRKIKSYEEKKENGSSSNDSTMKGITSQNDINYGFESFDSNQNDSILNIMRDEVLW